MNDVHPAKFMDSYLRICSDEQRFVDQTLRALNVAGVTGAALDCAVGTGFGTIRLLGRGHSIVCSDGSTQMLEKFHQNCQRSGITHRSIHARWANLGAYFPGVFDLVMCRGNSLTYADSWDAPADALAMQTGLTKIANHLEGMAGAVRTGGSLLIDLPRSGGTETESFVHRGKTDDGRMATISETITTDPRLRRRHWSMQMRSGADLYVLERSSHLISPEDVVPILLRCGFQSVVSLAQHGVRDHYASLLAIGLHRTP